jgi:glycerol uptake facilitator-like aquaporin
MDASLVGTGAPIRHRGSLYRFMYDAETKNTHDGYALGLGEIGMPLIQATICEFMGMFIYEFLFIGLVGSVAASNVFYYSVMQAVLYIVLILSFGTTSGAHLNPLVTAGMMATGKTSILRGLLYMVVQIIAASLAGTMFLNATSNTYAPMLGICGYSDSEPNLQSFNGGYLLVFYMIAYFMLLFGIFRVAMDPRHSSFFGPHGTMVIIGLLVAMLSMASSGFSAVGIYMNTNPAMCTASYTGFNRTNGSVSTYNSDLGATMSWVATAFMAVLLAAMQYFVAPHYTMDEKEEVLRNANRLRKD